MQQFFVESIDPPRLSKEQIHQCKNVLRMKENSMIRLVDDSGKGVLARFTDSALTHLEVVESLSWMQKRYKLHLTVSLIRNERLEWLIQKATECGVDTLHLYRSDHGVVRDFGKREQRKLERLQSIAIEAAEQSHRQFYPKIEGILDLDDIHKTSETYYADIGAYPHIVNELRDKNHHTTHVILGPEGGFSEKERSYFKKHGIAPVSLGHHVLRAETASIYVCTAVSLLEVLV